MSELVGQSFNGLMWEETTIQVSDLKVGFCFFLFVFLWPGSSAWLLALFCFRFPFCVFGFVVAVFGGGGGGWVLPRP